MSLTHMCRDIAEGVLYIKHKHIYRTAALSRFLGEMTNQFSKYKAI